MFLHIFSIVLLFSTVFAINIPGRLSAEEAAELRRTCGRRPELGRTFKIRNEYEDVYQGDKKSIGSKLTTRIEAPWVTSQGMLISKRHIITCAHCVPRLAQSSYVRGNAKIVMTCYDSNNIMNCTEKPLLELKIDQISYSSFYGSSMSRKMKIDSDIAILTLKEDIEMSDILYPACVAGYSIGKEEPVVNYGYGYSSPKEVAQGRDQANFLQTFIAKRITEYTPSWYRRDLPGFYGVDPVGSSSQPGDSGSGFIHTKNGTASVYAVMSGGYPNEDFILRVSAHLYWINYITGMDVKDEDMEFTGYFYPLVFKDKRVKKVLLAGAQHPNRVLNYINSK